MAEGKHVKQIANGWAVSRHVGITGGGNRIGEVVAAARRQRLQSPVTLDELQDRDAVGIGVVDVSAFGEVGGDDQRNMLVKSAKSDVNSAKCCQSFDLRMTRRR